MDYYEIFIFVNYSTTKVKIQLKNIIVSNKSIRRLYFWIFNVSPNYTRYDF